MVAAHLLVRGTFVPVGGKFDDVIQLIEQLQKLTPILQSLHDESVGRQKFEDREESVALYRNPEIALLQDQFLEVYKKLQEYQEEGIPKYELRESDLRMVYFIYEHVTFVTTWDGLIKKMEERGINITELHL